MAHKPTTRDFVDMFLLSAIWGASFLFLRVAAPVFGPVFLIEMRVLSALLVLFPFCLYMNRQSDAIRNWRVIFLLSLSNMSIPFCLIAFATLSVTAGFASIINATVPFFAAFFAFTFWSQKLSWLSVIGMLIGFLGVIVLVFDPAASTSVATNWIAIAAALVASALYGNAANITSHKLKGVSGLAVTTGSLLFAAVCIAPFAYWQKPEVMPSGTIWLNVIALGVVCTGLAYLLFYRLITRVGPHQALMTTYLIPLFSILWGKLFLAEDVTLFMLFGCTLVLLGVGLTTERISLPAVLLKRFGRQASLPTEQK